MHTDIKGSDSKMLTTFGMNIPSKGLSALYSTTFNFMAPALFSNAI